MKTARPHTGTGGAESGSKNWNKPALKGNCKYSKSNRRCFLRPIVNALRTIFVYGETE
jgi:hypothetical protein